MGKNTPEIVVGYEYRMGLHAVLGVKPINRILEIECDNKTLRAGTFSGGTITIDNPVYFEGGEVPDGIAGEIDFHIDGEPTFNNYLRNNYGIPFEQVPRFDEVAHLVFRGFGTAEGSGGFYVGNQPRPREMIVYAERHATQCPYDQWALLPYTHPKWDVEVVDFNPLVMHWELLQRGQTHLYGDTWEAAAEVLHGEGFGVYYYGGGGERDALEQEICRYIDARVYTDRATGLREIQLIRKDFDADDLVVIGEADIIGEPDLTLPDRSAAVNTLDITYSDRAKMWKKSVVRVQNEAHVEVYGVNRQSVDYSWVTTRSRAAKLGWRDITAQAYAGISGTVRVSGLRPDLHEGSPFILDLPSWGQSTVVCRILRIRERGIRDNSVDVTFTADAFGVEVDPIVVEDEPEDNSTEALPAGNEIAFEAPYYLGATRFGSDFTDALADDSGFGALMTAASAPNGVHMGYEAWVSTGGGSYVRRATGSFTGAGGLVGAITRMQTSIETTPISGLAVGDLVLLGGTEFVRVDSFTTGSTYSLTVGRGCIDTAPVAHADGVEVMSMARALGVPQDYTDGQALGVQLLTFLSGDILTLAEASAMAVTMDTRAFRPYPPGQFKVDGSYEDGLSLAADPVLTWVPRNRLVQTDETHAEDHDEAGIAAEAGTTYVVRAEWISGAGASLGFAFDADVGSVLTYTPTLGDPPDGAAWIDLSVAAKRDGIESWTRPTIRALAEAAPINTVAPVISGTPTVGETLTVTPGIWTS